ncbi:succinyl-CoA--3-ketoacid-CoA transferase, partial [Streptococcus pyogenes]
GKAKILDKCTLPLTAQNVVNLIITEMGVFEYQDEGLCALEINQDYTFEDVQNVTEVTLIDKTN